MIMKLDMPCLEDLRLTDTKVTADCVRTLKKHKLFFQLIMVGYEDYFRSDQLFKVLPTLIDLSKE